MSKKAGMAVAIPAFSYKKKRNLIDDTMLQRIYNKAEKGMDHY